jgi:hypothetical protein
VGGARRGAGLPGPDRAAADLGPAPPEAACGLLAYVDRGTRQVRKFEGNAEHPGSRGRNCAKGPAFVRRWWNWQEYLTECHPGRPATFEEFERLLAGLVRLALAAESGDLPPCPRRPLALREAQAVVQRDRLPQVREGRTAAN